MDYTFCLDLGEFPRIGFPQNLPVSTTVGHCPVIIEFYMLIWLFRDEEIAPNVKNNVNWNILIVLNHAPIQTVLLNVEGLLMIALMV